MVMLGDGLVSNGEAIISGGNLEIWGAKSVLMETQLIELEN